MKGFTTSRKQSGNVRTRLKNATDKNGEFWNDTLEGHLIETHHWTVSLLT